MTDVSDYPLWTLTTEDIQALCDRLSARGSSSLTTYSRAEQADLLTASRVIRGLLRRYEKAVGRTLQVLMIEGGI